MVNRPFVAHPPVEPVPDKMRDWAVRQFRQISEDLQFLDVNALPVVSQDGYTNWRKVGRVLECWGVTPPLYGKRATIAFPERYRFEPVVMATGQGGPAWLGAGLNADSAEVFTDRDGVTIHWYSIGEAL